MCLINQKIVGKEFFFFLQKTVKKFKMYGMDRKTANWHINVIN